jgi:hypothetical protein
VSDLPKRFLAPEYMWWRSALARDRKPVQSDNPQCGVYRWQGKAVEIWRDPDLKQLCCTVDGQLYDMILCKERWVSFLDDNNRQRPGICSEPITLEAFRWHMKHGEWPGDSPVAKKVAADLSAVPEGAIGVPTNAPPEGPELLVSQLDELERDAKRMMDKGAAKTQADADEAAKVADVIEKIEKTVEATHRDAKAPHLAAGRAIDAMWFPLRDRAAELKKRLKAIVITPFLIADRDRREHENAALVAKGVEPAAISDPKAKAAGYTRTTSLRTRKAAEITDYSELLRHLADHPEVKATVQRIADASARANIALPGMTIKTITNAV